MYFALAQNKAGSASGSAYLRGIHICGSYVNGLKCAKNKHNFAL